MGPALLETSVEGLPKRRGKVRDVYDLGDGRLLIVATDRISAYDWVLPNGIPDKGRVLNGISAYWFRVLPFGGGRIDPEVTDVARVANRVHFLSTGLDDAGLDLAPETRAALEGRSMVVRRADVVPFECVVRGYLAGSAWREYQVSGTVGGEPLPPGLVEAGPIGGPLFTPATKASSGHDENISYARLVEALGPELAGTLRERSEGIYEEACKRAESRGLILADTKFEWGHDSRTGELLLVDEILTPDSSRYWPLDGYEPGRPQPSFDKQYVRDWLDASGWDRASPPPLLPDDVVARTRDTYLQAYEILTGHPFPWN